MVQSKNFQKDAEKKQKKAGLLTHLIQQIHLHWYCVTNTKALSKNSTKSAYYFNVKRSIVGRRNTA